MLEREDVRVVHACWDHEMVEIARRADNAVELHHHYATVIEAELCDSQLDAVDRGLAHQNQNPVKRLTSGPELRVSEPIVASGKVRYEQRV